MIELNPLDIIGRNNQISQIFRLAKICREKNNISSAESDLKRIYFVGVSLQNSFLSAEFNNIPLSTQLAPNIAEWIVKNSDKLTKLLFFNDANPISKFSFNQSWTFQNEPVETHPMYPESWPCITNSDIQDGKYVPVHSEVAQLTYVRKLESAGLPGLQVFNPYSLIGTEGAAIQRTISTAAIWHTALRFMEPEFYLKNTSQRTDEWGPFIDLLGNPTENHEALKKTLSDEVNEIYIAGQPRIAAIETAKQLMELAPSCKIYVLSNCCAHINIPWLTNFTNTLEREVSNAGVKLIESDQEIKD